ncbi:flotillin family protein, partial [bacterium]
IASAEIEKQQALELAEQDRRIAVAERSRAQSEADAQAATARAEAVRAEEGVITVRETEIAERRKAIELVAAAEEAERAALKISIAASAERKASEDRAVALSTATSAEAEAVRVRAEAEARRLAVAAEGELALNNARNTLSAAMVEAQIKQALIEHLPAIIRESVKPMENIDGIKIVQVSGLGGDGHSSGGGDGHGGSLADSVVNSALRYRAQAPLLDSLLKEVGLDGADVNRLIPMLSAPSSGSGNGSPTVTKSISGPVSPTE